MCIYKASSNITQHMHAYIHTFAHNMFVCTSVYLHTLYVAARRLVNHETIPLFEPEPRPFPSFRMSNTEVHRVHATVPGKHRTVSGKAGASQRKCH